MSHIYAYEVTASSVPGTEVGGCLIDVETEPSPDRSWPLWNQAEGKWEKGIQAVRREQMCWPCFRWEPQLVRVHDHDGAHGPHGTAKQYEPGWMAASGRATLCYLCMAPVDESGDCRTNGDHTSQAQDDAVTRDSGLDALRY